VADISIGVRKIQNLKKNYRFVILSSKISPNPEGVNDKKGCHGEATRTMCGGLNALPLALMHWRRAFAHMVRVPHHDSNRL